MENPMKNPELHPVQFLSLVERLDFCEKIRSHTDDFDDNPPTKPKHMAGSGMFPAINLPSYRDI